MSKRQICGAVILFNDKFEVLLGNKIKDGAWEFPGGKAEPDETILTTVIRELREETNLYVPHLKYIGYYDRNPKYLVHMFTAQYGDESNQAPYPELMEPHKHTEWIWTDELTKCYKEPVILTEEAHDVVQLGFYNKALHQISKNIPYEGLI